MTAADTLSPEAARAFPQHVQLIVAVEEAASILEQHTDDPASAAAAPAAIEAWLASQGPSARRLPRAVARIDAHADALRGPQRALFEDEIQPRFAAAHVRLATALEALGTASGPAERAVARELLDWLEVP